MIKLKIYYIFFLISLISLFGCNLNDGASVGRPLLDLGGVGGTVLEDRLVVVHVCYENDHHGRRGVHLKQGIFINHKTNKSVCF